MIGDCGLLIEIYKFYENWSTETFRKKKPRRWDACGALLLFHAPVLHGKIANYLLCIIFINR